ncbi:MAG: hypothetical protein CMD29_02405 [Flavobacteriales bacterium]|nr:hypothetical protein [Flavobacteriales bacterium]
MQKNFVLAVLFIFPVVIYLFFASGKNNFAKLPVLTNEINDLSDFKTHMGGPVKLDNHITILCYWGSNLDFRNGDAFNLNQKIYKRFYKFKDFQFVVLLTNDQEKNIENLKESLSSGAGTDLVKWKFLKGSKESIEEHFNSLNTSIYLDSKFSTKYVFIIDRKKNLRGRDDDEDTGFLYGYNAESVAEINNKMEDDVKVILAEYRLALKKYSLR